MAAAVTDDLSIISTDHGRKRRSERNIDKNDLRAAVLHGVRTPALPCPRTGAPRWMFTFADIVYITDETARVEVTSYPLRQNRSATCAPQG